MQPVCMYILSSPVHVVEPVFVYNNACKVLPVQVNCMAFF